MSQENNVPTRERNLNQGATGGPTQERNCSSRGDALRFLRELFFMTRNLAVERRNDLLGVFMKNLKGAKI